MKRFFYIISVLLIFLNINVLAENDFAENSFRYYNGQIAEQCACNSISLKLYIKRITSPTGEVILRADI